MSKSTIEILTQAKTLITPPNAWTQHAFARARHDGPAVYSLSTEATCWCAQGAVNVAAGGTITAAQAHLVLARAAEQIDPEATPAWVNDRLGHTKTLVMFDLAIELAGASPTKS